MVMVNLALRIFAHAVAISVGEPRGQFAPIVNHFVLEIARGHDRWPRTASYFARDKCAAMVAAAVADFKKCVAYFSFSSYWSRWTSRRR